MRSLAFFPISSLSLYRRLMPLLTKKKADQPIVREGDEGHSIFVLEWGHCTVVMADVKVAEITWCFCPSALPSCRQLGRGRGRGTIHSGWAFCFGVPPLSPPPFLLRCLLATLLFLGSMGLFELPPPLP